ncbi:MULTISPECIES: TetR/AcrR family transcriptional regulator [unclassified Burkholderia]|uniref:TetR/AcrR family transcriptional regulator n=1 Tax=unclassified Burkholderia TaxID=2613784 RepID=UPI000F5AB0E8|nr:MULTISPECIES: TetR/AcrR family transcriptional regulator [unclassified Burkholderia]RQR30357.1 TetR/AcrR family transcriptional regulator [Burkholderia sp. Bp9131]RQR62682.1 TetR/AcrR family transcriptional regulator [Burkholderia sp. Bp9015]RQR95631.1 TetR/AcrR family transcriptional regulator [Burkholderia sp. Bp8991]RQS19299.1 TetR/AcrR family transcriptional regulator [Burkholderia sp. Bp8995]RQS38997.1 TetR/AcrR family transcriptional regulator [Burkholderia sp. Bp8989]
MKKRPEPALHDIPAPVDTAESAAPQASGAPAVPGSEADSAPVAGVRRKKAPEQVRAQLLKAASEIATHHGVAALTLDAVAERAGVTKGALQYHFANKQGLLDALFGQATERFATQMAARRAADSHGDGAAARAYLHAVLDTAQPAASTDVLRVLVASMITEQETRARWSVPMREWTRPDPVPLERAATLMICRLAADGLWISELLDSVEISAELRAEIVRQLDRMTAAEPAGTGTIKGARGRRR